MSCPYQNIHCYKLLIYVLKIKYILEHSNVEPNLLKWLETATPFFQPEKVGINGKISFS